MRNRSIEPKGRISALSGALPDNHLTPGGGEVDAFDNEACALRAIVITILGDVDGNLAVNILDVAKTTAIYGSKQGDLIFYVDSDVNKR